MLQSLDLATSQIAGSDLLTVAGLFYAREHLRGGTVRLDLAYFGMEDASLRLLVGIELISTSLRAGSLGQLVREGGWL